jgi:hypothetical protein
LFNVLFVYFSVHNLSCGPGTLQQVASWCRFLLQKLLVVQLYKKFPTFTETQVYYHVHNTPPVDCHPESDESTIFLLRSISTFSSYLYPCLPNGSLPFMSSKYVYVCIYHLHVCYISHPSHPSRFDCHNNTDYLTIPLPFCFHLAGQESLITLCNVLIMIKLIK